MAKLVRIFVSGEGAGSTVMLLISKVLNEQGIDCQIKSSIPNQSYTAVAESIKSLSEQGVVAELYEAPDID